MLVLPEGISIRACWFGMEEIGEDLGNGGIEGRNFRDLVYLEFPMSGLLPDGKGFGEGGGRVGGAEGFAGDSGAGTVVNEYLVVRISAIMGRPNDLYAVVLQVRDQSSQGCRLPVKGPVDPLADRGQVVEMVGAGVVKLILQARHGGAARQLRGHYGRADLVALVIEGVIINAIIAVGFAA